MFLLVYTEVTYSEVHYITPSPNGPCPQNSSCLTLPQFAANSIHNITDISLLFQPGNHTLGRELFLTRVNNVSMSKDGLGNEKVFVDCSSSLGRFHISETFSVSINSLHFISCGSNIVSQVKWLTITGSTFQSVQNRTTVLELNEISNATIVGSSFLSNSLNYHNFSRTNILDYVYFERSTPRGALYTAFSNVSVINCRFMHNRASSIGGALVAYNSSLYLARSTCSNNTANLARIGGVMVMSGSKVDIYNNAFINNAAQHGGVIVAYNDTITISSTTFANNSANANGGVMITFGDSLFDIVNSTFNNNSADRGGVMCTSGNSFYNINNCIFTNNSAGISGSVIFCNNTVSGSFKISDSFFTNNTANYNGVISTYDDSSFDISNSAFTNNAASYGGVIASGSGDSLFIIRNSAFTENTALWGGVIWIVSAGSQSLYINNSTFANNSVSNAGGVMTSTSNNSSFIIINSAFINNIAAYGGVVLITDGSLTVSNSIFVNNKANEFGAVIQCTGGTLNIDSSNFSLNVVFNRGGGVFIIRQCSTYITNSNFYQNNGSIFAFNSNITFSGYIKFEKFMEPVIIRNGVTSQEGGAITSFQSTVIFTRKSTVHFSNNRASYGGAILATGSTITMYGETSIVDSTANSSGGGISLKQSRLQIKGNCQLVKNIAERGGGIQASSSTIAVYKPGTLQVTNNSAEFGGGIYLEENPKLYVLKNTYDSIADGFMYLINFTGNHANRGGAMYVMDDTNSGACSPDIECFIQTLALYQFYDKNSLGLFFTTILFSENTASEQGPNLFGGLLDRCIPSPFAEVSQASRMYYSGITYLKSISNIELDSISSQPVRVCFCNSEQEPDCSYQPPTIRVQKGKPFNVSLVAVDQVNHSVYGYFIAESLSSTDVAFGEGQRVIGKNYCSVIPFNVFSPHKDETLILYPDGPCGSAILSTNNVTIQFINCTCPVGFEPLSNSQSSTRCECVCDSALSPYITECNITTGSVLRKDTNSWITYINDTDPPEYVIYQNCPFDYCQPQTKNVTINFNLPNGADSQCAYDRTGVLCGACKEDLSLSLASSRCVPCHAQWPAVCSVIVLAGAIAGILLVTALLALNMTVSVGLINGFIFYANIVSAGSAIFFPSSEPSFPSVFVAWLNLDIGIDVCFIDGLDAYTKTWLELAFPVYIISLVVMVIIVSEYSPKFARLIGKKDPVSTLATLILLSYAKLLSVTITALSSAVLHYPGGEQETVWLPDGNVPYFQGKHIPLALVALLIIIIGLPYTILLLLWQWIVCAPNWKVFNWTRNTKLNAFITTYHIPHNSKYRYWTGLLLLVRVVLYITASVTISSNPQTFPLITVFLVGGLTVFKNIFGRRVYEKSFVDTVDTVLYFNLSTLSLFSLYDFKASIMKQTAVAYTSTLITFILFIGAIVYHVTLLIKKERPTEHEDFNEYLLAPDQPVKAKVTHSVIELLKPNQDPPPSKSKDSDEQEITEDRQIVTPPYEP